MPVSPVFSPLCKRTVGTNKYSSRSGRKVERLIVHHTAGGTNEGNIKLLSTGVRKVSATYVLQTTGALCGIVPEQYRPWTSGSASVDGNAVTVETVNTSGAPSWKVSAAQLETLAQLAADLCRRYGWGRVDRSRVRGHREFASTECPGPYLYPRLGDIIARANAILAGGSASAGNLAPAPTPVPEEDIMATKEELAQIVKQQVNAALVDYSEKQNRFIDRTDDKTPARSMSHFTVQGHAAAIAAARNSAAVLGRVAGLESALAAVASGRDIDASVLADISVAAEAGVKRGLEGAIVTVELGGAS